MGDEVVVRSEIIWIDDDGTPRIHIFGGDPPIRIRRSMLEQVTRPKEPKPRSRFPERKKQRFPEAHERIIEGDLAIWQTMERIGNSSAENLANPIEKIAILLALRAHHSRHLPPLPTAQGTPRPGSRFPR
ncbi:hypothetical protein PYH37_004768 [Sinorhizobium numidicum]|uniref:Transposase n=1 Tax=Sinorhizobium numidicum TaxID=680248 RepID=A0ABY8CYD3_9HYPH|nr:hypothetical protein [Sinorhizobium numidicum]WEX76461.1 hypothetical protein PYH37_004768 [Sinorhizobium numidicum]WEX83122.1 hypothetical protein PYH38_005480 [Sinorhizobium numidicum]